MTATGPNGLLLTVPETARRLRVSEKTVRRLIGRQELPARHVGSLIRVDEGELQAWLYAEAPARQRQP
jgi:excisionase family DNA binding protein